MLWHTYFKIYFICTKNSQTINHDLWIITNYQSQSILLSVNTYIRTDVCNTFNDSQGTGTYGTKSFSHKYILTLNKIIHQSISVDLFGSEFCNTIQSSSEHILNFQFFLFQFRCLLFFEYFVRYR